MASFSILMAVIQYCIFILSRFLTPTIRSTPPIPGHEYSIPNIFSNLLCCLLPCLTFIHRLHPQNSHIRGSPQEGKRAITPPDAPQPHPTALSAPTLGTAKRAKPH